ncbi:hypothetical protein R3P38DRAFT_2780631 [Favolaschia claudopus]|uniref:F-box domain-containing protein n=1 Tax=Favolaschia claudopus TaxID=2862362 RepID=A0AAW0BAY4_9AGAR
MSPPPHGTNSIHDGFPPEVEEVIFFHTLNNPSSWIRFDVDRGNMVQVSRRWRNVIQGSARIWTTVVLHHAMNLEHIMYTVGQIRSTSTHLQVVVDTQATDGGKASLKKYSPTQDAILNWAETVLPFCSSVVSRASHITVTSLTHDCVVAILEGISFSSALGLEVLCCRAREHMRYRIPCSHPPHGHDATLRVLTLDKVVPTWDILDAYANLCHLSLRDIPYPINRYTARALLETSPALASIDVANVTFHALSMDDDMTDIVAPHVTDLSLAFGAYPSLNLPPFLKLPKLKSLKLESNLRPSWSLIGGLCLEYLHAVEYFSMKCPFMDLTALDCLRHLRAATHIDVRHCRGGLTELLYQNVY